MNPNLIFYIVIVLFVIFRISNRAYSAYTSGYKTWPILAGLAAIYVVVAILRFTTGFQSLVFFAISFGCIILSQIIYSSSRNSA